jgi:small subunit ribosomal protein S3
MALYYKTGKLQKLKKKRIIKNINSRIIKSKSNKYFIRALKTLFSILKQNNLNFKILVLNNKIKKKFVVFLHKKLKSYIKNLFTRKISTYVDILNLSAIYFSGRIEFEPLCKMLSDLFRFIQKRNHSKFFLFIKKLFKLLVFRLNKKFKIKNRIGGIKVKIKGRLKGKPRAGVLNMSIGKIPIQTLSANIEYVKAHANTPHYGTFGFKYWIFKK